MGRLEPSNLFLTFFSFKGGIIIHTPSNYVILFEVLKAVLQFKAPFLINSVQQYQQSKGGSLGLKSIEILLKPQIPNHIN